MAIFKCKICGGTLEITSGETVATCEYCGTKQTLPKLDDEKKANLFDRANHFRRNNDFDKAMGIYEQILNEDTEDAESYWSIVLCRYGIEYVEDPSSRKRVSTVNRAQFTSVFDDEDYKSAIKYADAHQRELYEKEATAINEIQKGILAISGQEEPFDVFICYKETDANGRRTQDSVLATELYHELTREGYKVFFSRITLEDKLGTAYEPYIFAALNSSKVMVVLGTRPEYFNAVWVRNEWSRYLALIKQGQKKMLIPAYRDMDPYDLPEEFSHLQAQDMSKLGFMQDLVRGITKLVSVDKTSAVKETVVVQSAVSGNASALVKRGFLALEDGDWNKADEFFEQALNQNAEDAQAYLGKLMAELQVKNQEELKNCKEPFDSSTNYQKAIRFADSVLASELKWDISFIKDRNEEERLNQAYTNAVSLMDVAKTEDEFNEAEKIFDSIKNYKDSNALANECKEKAKEAYEEFIRQMIEIDRKDSIYKKACNLFETAVIWNGKDTFSGTAMGGYEEALRVFESLESWKDSAEKAIECRRRIQEIQQQIEEDKLRQERKKEIERIAKEKARKRNKILAIITPIIALIVAFIVVLNIVIIPNSKYNAAVTLMDAGNINEAYSIFIELGDYKDAADKAGDIKLTNTKERFKGIKVGSYINFGEYEQNNNTSNGKEEIEWLVLDIQDSKALVISKYALDCKPYNTSYTYVTWEICTLRNWLNNDFINAAFSNDEKAMISTVTVSADKNLDYSTNPGNATQDQVFLLSITEANKYFSSYSARQCKPTKYALAGGVYVDSSNGNCWWWLRSPGIAQNYAARVSYDGYVYKDGVNAPSAFTAVRPAMWIELPN